MRRGRTRASADGQESRSAAALAFLAQWYDLPDEQLAALRLDLAEAAAEVGIPAPRVARLLAALVAGRRADGDERIKERLEWLHGKLEPR